MASIPEYFNMGEIDEKDPEAIIVILQRMYTDLAQAINQKPDLVTRNTDGQTSEAFLSNGTLNINLTTNKVEMLTNHTNSTTVVWTTLS